MDRGVAAMRPVTTLSPAQARRVALAAQGLIGTRPQGAPGRRRLLDAIARLGLLQIDSVNVLSRAHYLPLFSRLGAYDRTLLDKLAGHHGGPIEPAGRVLFEYWAHEASLLPVALQPLLRWRMARAHEGTGVWSGVASYARANADAVRRALGEVAARGPLAVSMLEERGQRGAGGWWGWSDGKIALEWLFWTGQITAAGRKGFERLYDLPERVLPPAVLNAPTPDEHDSHRALLRLAAQALGVATEGDLRDYFRLGPTQARPRLVELAEAGEILPVTVEGWKQPAWLHRDAQIPARATGRALLVPFDPLIWERARTERLFGFRYRIEIYTPEAKRAHGYYVLPFLLGDRLVARVDLKADRATGRLLVQSAHAEPGSRPGAVAEALAQELALLAGWLGLSTVAVQPKGDLATALAEAVAALPA